MKALEPGIHVTYYLRKSRQNWNLIISYVQPLERLPYTFYSIEYIWVPAAAVHVKVVGVHGSHPYFESRLLLPWWVNGSCCSNRNLQCFDAWIVQHERRHCVDSRTTLNSKLEKNVRADWNPKWIHEKNYKGFLELWICSHFANNLIRHVEFQSTIVFTQKLPGFWALLK